MSDSRPVFPVYDFGQNSELHARFSVKADELGYTHANAFNHRFLGETVPLGEVFFSENRDGEESSYACMGENYVVKITAEDGFLWVRVLADSAEAAEAAVKLAKVAMPASEPAEDKVPVAFWAYGQHGPFSINRDLTAMRWEEVGGNYAEEAHEGLVDLFEESFRPGFGGQLILWHGPAGTGKTNALRTLAQEWRDWAELHYITDPEKFWGTHSDYMLHVMLGAGEGRPKVVGENDEDKWRILVLEDCGEMLSANARQDTGAALGRFLNVVDGLIGQGLRILVLATTNEAIDKWHEAVVRPGRAATIIRFDNLSREEVEEWWKVNGPAGTSPPEGDRSLASLYAAVGGFDHAGPEKKKNLVGFASA